MGIFCVFNNSFYASRKIFDRSLDNNGSAKKDRKMYTNEADFRWHGCQGPQQIWRYDNLALPENSGYRERVNVVYFVHLCIMVYLIHAMFYNRADCTAKLDYTAVIAIFVYPE